MKKAIVWILYICFIYSTLGAPRGWKREEAPLVNTGDQGVFSGIHIDDRVDAFLGIPYAQAPVKELRFAKTKRVEKHTSKEIRNASRFGASCLQPPVQVTSDTSEDCLFLNIHRPSFSSLTHGSLPVMVWIHGGSWVMGSGSMSFYNGTALLHRSLELNEPVIVVTLNYRIGAFGFLAGDLIQIAEKEDSNAVLNAGLHDQREALRWIRRHIASFGGDINRVTIMGESAGANSVAAQMLARKGHTKGLFSGAIMQSGSIATLPRVEATSEWPLDFLSVVLEEAGCKIAISLLACLRQADWEKINHANNLLFQKGRIFSPVRDDYFVMDSPTNQFNAGQFNHSVPFIQGNVLDEGTQFATSYVDNLTSDEAFESVISFIYGKVQMASLMPDILRLWPNNPSLGQPNRPYYYGTLPNNTFYPPDKNGNMNQYKRLASFLHDTVIEAGRRQHLFAANEFGIPAWSFRFAQPVPEGAPFVKFQDSISLGVQHASDLPFTFGYLPKAPDMSKQPSALRPFITDEQIEKVMETMTAAWIHFANRGDPNGVNVPTWPTWSNYGEANDGSKMELIFQPEGIKIQKDTYHWDQVDWILRHSDAFGM